VDRPTVVDVVGGHGGSCSDSAKVKRGANPGPAMEQSRVKHDEVD
jgi:hypothetical protein